ncbi:MAG: hypothetical protein ACXWYM_00080 [Candidatus Binatia bacterium]
MKTFFQLLWRQQQQPREKQAQIMITSTGFLCVEGSLPDSIIKRCHEIAKTLGYYEDRMVEFARKTARHHAFIQSLRATYDPNKEEVEVFGTGIKNFVWSGNLESFFLGEKFPIGLVERGKRGGI